MYMKMSLAGIGLPQDHRAVRVLIHESPTHMKKSLAGDDQGGPLRMPSHFWDLGARIACLLNGIALSVAENELRGTSLVRKRTPLGPYRKPMPRVLRGS